MKRFICLIISLCLILGSFSFVFASATSWDTSDQTNLSNAASRLYYNGYSAAYYLKQIADRVSSLSTIASDVSTIKGYLFDDGHSIGYWTSAISSWMSPIYNAITATPTELQTIINSLNKVTSSGGTTTYTPWLGELYNVMGNYGQGKSGVNSWDFTEQTTYAHRQLFYNNNGNFSGNYRLNKVNGIGSFFIDSKLWQYGTPLGNLAVILQEINDNFVSAYIYDYQSSLTGYNTQQTALNWGNLGNSYFTPSSQTDGIYKWFAAIQAPVSRLSYVLASDERIAAQQAAAPAEQEVVNDFIDPAGNSSATASDFGSISDLSSGYQQNFGSTASISGIFDIFDSNNFGWFSSETYNQLDTTVAQRGSCFETPLLDQQLEDISRALGVDYAN